MSSEAFQRNLFLEEHKEKLFTNEHVIIVIFVIFIIVFAGWFSAACGAASRVWKWGFAKGHNAHADWNKDKSQLLRHPWLKGEKENKWSESLRVRGQRSGSVFWFLTPKAWLTVIQMRIILRVHLRLIWVRVIMLRFQAHVHTPHRRSTPWPSQVSLPVHKRVWCVCSTYACVCVTESVPLVCCLRVWAINLFPWSGSLHPAEKRRKAERLAAMCSSVRWSVLLLRQQRSTHRCNTVLKTPLPCLKPGLIFPRIFPSWIWSSLSVRAA